MSSAHTGTFQNRPERRGTPSFRIAWGLGLAALLVATAAPLTATASPDPRTVQREAADASSHALTSDAGTSRGFGPTRTVLAWSRFESNIARIVIGHPKGGSVQELTDPADGVLDIDPKFSPDGSRLLFERDLPDGTAQIMVINVDGTGERVLPLGCVDPCVTAVAPTWAPDGRHVYFTRVVGPFDQVNDSATSAVLYRSALDGGHLARVSPPGIDGAYEEYLASFAPAGYMIFLRLRNADIKSAAFRRDRDGRITQLTPYELDADELSVSPATSGKSKDLVVFETYGHGAPDGVAAAVATVPATCRSVAQCDDRVRYLTSPKSLPDQHFNPAWSPDGKQVAFVRFSFVDPGPAIGDIWRMDWNGRHPRPVSTSPLFEFRPTWGRSARGAH